MINLIKKNYAIIFANFFSDIHTYPRLVVPVPSVSTLPVPPYSDTQYLFTCYCARNYFS